MSPEIKVAFSREVPRGSCIIGIHNKEEDLKYMPIAITDCQSTDIFADGIVRKLLKEGENPVIVFGSEEEMEENINIIYKAFGDLIKDE